MSEITLFCPINAAPGKGAEMLAALSVVLIFWALLCFAACGGVPLDGFWGGIAAVLTGAAAAVVILVVLALIFVITELSKKR